jgi:hypothetical protein
MFTKNDPSSFTGFAITGLEGLISIILIVFVFAFYMILYQVFLWPYFFSPLRKIPGPSGNPITGHLLTIIREEPAVPHQRWVKEFGPVVRIVGPVGLERLIFTKPEALHKILVSEWQDNPRPRFMRHILGLVAGYGLLTVTGNDHKQMRKAMNPAFSIPNLTAHNDMYYHAIDG